MGFADKIFKAVTVSVVAAFTYAIVRDIVKKA
jgi:hypothetical protein